ncbi:hypothetical protein TW65_08213 [Stemphylium lycopersici]|uniref:Uncharacterized protein n=1 Tax=Stemphylium lycopersici TaxID=183478 RepID=A0A364NH06_STELY|nr:hypothetical protein TW65_08213 [Stemphylium lycopersici]RAR16393.1 hypothetical protein DDE83_000266 [Stemphylium lycopersici]
MKLLAAAAAAAALVALAAGEATGGETNAVAASIINPTPKYENSGDITYYCDHDVGVMAHPANGAARATTETCLAKYIENQRGAECSPDIPVALAKKDLFSREAEDVNNAVTQHDSHKIDAKPNAPETSPQDLTPFDIHESCGICISGGGVAFCVPKKKDMLEARSDSEGPAMPIERRGCVPGTYRCSDPEIFTCNAKGEWVQSAYCGRNAKCIKRPPGIAHCVPRNMSLTTRRDPKARATEGSYACNEHFVLRFENGKWQDVEDCGPNLICARGDKGVGFCIVPPPSKHGSIAR